MIKLRKSPFWMFWKLPIEPVNGEAENVFGVAVLKIKLFYVEFIISETSELWLMSKISRLDFETIVGIVVKRVLIVKILIDALRIILFIIMILTFGVFVYVFVFDSLVVSALLAGAGLISVVLQKVVCKVFIKILEITEGGLASKFSSLNQQLLSQNRKILIGQRCFWIQFEAEDDHNTLEKYELNALSNWLNNNSSVSES